MTVDEAKKRPKVEILSSSTEAEHFSIDEPEDPGISDRDCIMSENSITKTNVGVAHSSIGTRNRSNTKISHDILTQDSDTEMEFFNTISTDLDTTSIYDDVLNKQPAVTSTILNEVYDDVLNTQPTVPPDNVNKVYDEVLNIKDEKVHVDNDCTISGSDPLYASIRSVQNKEPVYTAIDSLNTASEETYNCIIKDNYEDIKRKKASNEMKTDKNEEVPNRKEETFGDNKTDNNTEYEYISKYFHFYLFLYQI